MSVAAVTKAEALQRVRSHVRHADVPPFVFWTVDDWRRQRGTIVAACVAAFDGARLAVRSATRDEDRPTGGLAGHFRTELDVPADPDALARAVDRVVAGYPNDGRVHHVLVQAMVRGVRRSGVVTTRDPASGAPYDVIELADGPHTDVVTGGRGAASRVSIHHHVDPAAVERAGFGALVRAVRAVEAVRGSTEALEIELAERTDGTIALLQLRQLGVPIGASTACDRRVGRALASLACRIERLGRPRRGVAGATTVLGLMPDWNPAELIGSHPTPLAASLFRGLLADRTWQEARASMGYQAVPRTPLVHMLAGRPYVDVRASFNSFLPAGLAPRTRALLIDEWVAHLRDRPELHDRVELEVAETVLDFEAADTRRRRRTTFVHHRDGDAWRAALGALTDRAIDLGRDASLPSALRTVTHLRSARSRGGVAPLAATLAALDRCRTDGARPFAVVARHAFMAERLLRTSVTRGALAPERLVELRGSLTTVAGRFTVDWGRVARGTLPLERFLASYGHLRPGTFDVTSLPYTLRDSEAWARIPAVPAPWPAFVLRPSEGAALDRLLREARLGQTAAGLLAWARAAIVGREDAKFCFARTLSAILEDLARWGAAQELAREDLTMLTLGDLQTVAAARTCDTRWLRAQITAARARRRRERELRLGPLLRDPADLGIVYEPPVLPTFVTTRTVVATPVLIDAHAHAPDDVVGKIVCIESADPGFDWILARGIAGLVTRFGGVNSHMAVRCLELGIPAALGVGERVFERVCRTATVELRCGEGAVRDGEAAVTWCAG